MVWVLEADHSACLPAQLECQQLPQVVQHPLKAGTVTEVLGLEEAAQPQPLAGIAVDGQQGIIHCAAAVHARIPAAPALEMCNLLQQRVDVTDTVLAGSCRDHICQQLQQVDWLNESLEGGDVLLLALLLELQLLVARMQLRSAQPAASKACRATSTAPTPCSTSSCTPLQLLQQLGPAPVFGPRKQVALRAGALVISCCCSCRIQGQESLEGHADLGSPDQQLVHANGLHAGGAAQIGTQRGQGPHVASQAASLCNVKNPSDQYMVTQNFVWCARYLCWIGRSAQNLSLCFHPPCAEPKVFASHQPHRA